MAEPSLYSFVDATKKKFGGKNIQTIVELGARDCVETVEFHKILPRAKIYAFECNPNTLPICRKAVKNIQNIKLIEKAVSDENGTVKFYPINKEQTRTTWENGNQGASSLLKASGKYPVEDYVQDEVEVPSITLKSFMESENINKIDMLWMDIQGAELMALKGAGKRLRDIGTIHSEVEFMEIYSGQPLFKEVKRFLNHKGFWVNAFTTFGEYSADAIFVNRRIMPSSAWPKLWLNDKLIYRWKVRDYRQHTRTQRLRTLREWSLARRLDSFLLPRTMRIWNKLKLFYLPGRPILSIRRIALFAWIRALKPSLGLDINLKGSQPTSSTKLDVIIPVTKKDLAVLPHAIAGVRKNLAHPLGRIIIVAPNLADIKSVAKRLDCDFIDEAKVLPIKRDDIKYMSKNIDRSGWLYQQLLKLNGDEISKQENFLVLDADTILTREQIMIHGDRPIFNHSDEFHRPYFEVYTKMFGEQPGSSLSFVAHYMVVERGVLRQLKNTLENRHNKAWFRVIIDSINTKEFSAFSEYETYGNFYLRRNKRRPIRSYWFNGALSVEEVNQLDSKRLASLRNFKSVSLHTHEKI